MHQTIRLPYGVLWEVMPIKYSLHVWDPSRSVFHLVTPFMTYSRLYCRFYYSKQLICKQLLQSVVIRIFLRTLLAILGRLYVLVFEWEQTVVTQPNAVAHQLIKMTTNSFRMKEKLS